MEALVDIRLLLEEGVRQSGSSLAHDRLRCVITLDAAVERAAFFSIHHLQIEISAKNEKLENLLGLLAGHLGDKWRFQQRGELVRLHSARNKAQHEGLYPAQEHMFGFLAAARAGVVSLLLTTTGRDVSSVTLSDAIKDDALRHDMAAAELALEGQRYGESVEFANQALTSATASWTRRRGEAGVTLPRAPSFIGDFQEFQDISRSLDALMSNLRDVTDATAFATNPGELLWFRHLVKDVTRLNLSPSEQEARRAVSFVFEWVLRYEQLSAAFPTNRLAIHEAQQRKVRSTPASKVRVGSVAVEEASPYNVRMSFELVEVPPEEEFDLWRFHLAGLLGSGKEHNNAIYHWRVENSGCVYLSAFPLQSINRSPRTSFAQPTDEEKTQWLIPSGDVAFVAGELEQALAGVDEAVRRSEDEASERQRRQQEEDQELSARISGRLPAWVKAISWERDGLPAIGGKGYRVIAAPELPELEIAELVRQRDDVAQFWADGSRRESAYILMPADPAKDPIEILAAVGDEINDLVRSKSDIRETIEDWKASLRDRVTAAVLGHDYQRGR